MSHPLETLTATFPDASLSATHLKLQVSRKTVDESRRQSHLLLVVLFPYHPIRRISPA